MRNQQINNYEVIRRRLKPAATRMRLLGFLSSLAMTTNNVILLAVFSSMIILITGCGSSSTSSHAPLISNLQYSPASAERNTWVNLLGSVEFVDSEGDINSISVYNKNTGVRFSAGIDATSGVTSGTIRFWVLFITSSTPGEITIEIYFTDLAGNESNKVTATFTVT